VKLSIAREQLAAIVTYAIDESEIDAYSVGVVDHLPDSIAPPVVLVSWADPWLTPSTLCNYQAAMELVLVAQRLEPGGKLDILEQMLAAIVPTLKDNPEYQMVDATSPYPLQVGGVDYLAASINLTYDIGD
jgi:hypothetical protein